LTYHSQDILPKGSVISVPLKTTLKEAVIIEEVDKPEFETAEIASVSDTIYTTQQIEIAKFISEYYFSSFSEALSLFIPFKNSSSTDLSSESIEKKAFPILTFSQQKAYDALLKKEKALLFGVTGSGKTEIFISLMAKMLQEGKTSIFLMPEISLTPQMEKRLKVYFGDVALQAYQEEKRVYSRRYRRREDQNCGGGPFGTFCTVKGFGAHRGG